VFELGGLHLEPFHQPFYVIGFFETGCSELFAGAGFELLSSWSLPPEELGLQVWATDTWLKIQSLRFFKMQYFKSYRFLAQDFPGLYYTFFLCEVWIQDLILAKQVLYCLSHTFSPFCCGCFGDGGSQVLFAWNGLGPQSSSSQPPKDVICAWPISPTFGPDFSFFEKTYQWEVEFKGHNLVF
jgi:hypothetical protein